MSILFFAKIIAAVCGILAVAVALLVFCLALFGKTPPKVSRYEYEAPQNPNPMDFQ